MLKRIYFTLIFLAVFHSEEAFFIDFNIDDAFKDLEETVKDTVIDINDGIDAFKDDFNDITDNIDDFFEEESEFFTNFAEDIRISFNKGYEKFMAGKFLRFTVPGSEEAYRDTRYKLFSKNFKTLNDLQSQSLGFLLDDTVKFMFMTDSEKRGYTGLGNLTQLEHELTSEGTRPIQTRTKKVDEHRRNLRPSSEEVNEEQENSNCKTKKNGKVKCKKSKNKKKDKKKRRRKGKDNEDTAELKIERRAEEDGSLAESLDLRDLNIVTSVKDQEECESCWAFAAVGVLEGAFALATGFLRDFSEQNVINCNTKYGCSGGYWTRAWREIQTERYIALEEDQPYIARKQGKNCNRESPNGLTDIMTIGNFQVLRKQNEEEEMLGFLSSDGPVTVALKVNDTLFLYGSGVIPHCLGGKYEMQHAVILVGYDKNVMILKNSWGVDWGEDGYFRVARGCGPSLKGYSYWASYVSVVSQDTDATTPFNPEITEYGQDFFIFTQSNKIPQRISKDVTEVGIKDGDVLTLKILENAKPTSSKFTLSFLNGKDKVYRLQYVLQNNKFYCRQLSAQEGQGVLTQRATRCALSAGGKIEILVAGSGYSVDFDGATLPQFPHLISTKLINKLEVEVRGSRKLFESLTLTRRTEQQKKGGVIRLCFDKDQYCAVFKEENPDVCVTEQTSEWMLRNCPFSCGTCN